MKLNRLTPTSQLPRSEVGTDHRPAGNRSLVAPIASVADADADRRRSRQEEMEEMEAKTIGPFEGQEQVLRSAHDLAEQLAHLGPGADHLVRTAASPQRWHAIDDEA